LQEASQTAQNGDLPEETVLLQKARREMQLVRAIEIVWQTAPWRAHSRALVSR
jgi:hypothetical protein